MNVLAGKTRAVVLTLILPLLLLTACSHATKPVPPPGGARHLWQQPTGNAGRSAGGL
jgi:hypothetical protein